MRRSGAGSPKGEVVWIFFLSTVFSFIGVIREIRGQKLLNNSGLGRGPSGSMLPTRSLRRRQVATDFVAQGV